jgi:hypothetical protein
MSKTAAREKAGGTAHPSADRRSLNLTPAPVMMAAWRNPGTTCNPTQQHPRPRGPPPCPIFWRETSIAP